MSHTFLLVDDDPHFRALVSSLLVSRGHLVFEAATGRLATAAMQETRPDLVIVDGLLPDTDGLRWIRTQRELGDRTPVVFVSAFWKDMDSFQKLTRGLGVSMVIHKPISPATFVQQIDTALQQAGAALGAPQEPAKPTAAPPAVVALSPRPLPPPRVVSASSPLPERASITRSDIDIALAAVTADYARALPDKVADLRRLVERVIDGPRDPGVLTEVRSSAHKLSGTAGSYGFPRVGDAARGLEQLTVRALEGAPASAFEWARVLDQLIKSEGSAPVASLDEARSPAEASRSNRVLLVDDDPEFLKMAAALGRERALNLVTATSAAQALALAAEAPPDAAIIDLKLDVFDMSSFELARALRSLPGCEALPLAFVSSGGQLADRIAATYAGASLYLSKPLDAEMLSQAVHQLTAANRATRPRLLIVDDDEDFVRGVRAILHDTGLETTVLTNAALIVETLEDVRPDVMLLDATMGQFSGFDICRMVRTIPKFQDLVILFVTALGDTESRLAAFRVGADDYLIKPIVKEELLARIRVRVERSALLRERLDRDALTGLPLRRTFLEQLSTRMSEARRRSRSLALALLDVDHFKSINDTYGHLAGDRVLAALGNLLARRFRNEDLRGRWGGEEFVLAFAEESPATVGMILGRVLDEFSALDFRGDAGESFHVTFSAGISSMPTDGEVVHALLERADQRLYAAKLAGRRRIVCGDLPTARGVAQ